MGIGDLPGGSFSSGTTGMSADGSTVVGSSTTSGLFLFSPYRWSLAEGMVRLDQAGELLGGNAKGASADGSVIVGGGTRPDGIGEAFRWTAEDGIVGLGDLPGGPFASGANAISADGSVIVGSSKSDRSELFEAFRWTQADGMLPVGDLPGGSFFSKAFGVSADGSVIVGSSRSDNGKEAFYWTADEGMVGLGDLPGGGFFSIAWAVSADGSVIAGFSDGEEEFATREGFRWTAETGMIALRDPNAILSHLLVGGMSADGSVIVGTARLSPGATLFIWDPVHEARDLVRLFVDEYGFNLDGWQLSNIRGISGDGRTLAGEGVNSTGNTESWVAYLGPPPCRGDINKDNRVDLTDLVTLLANFATPSGAAHADGDVDYDMDIDLTDLAMLLGNFGKICE